MLASNVRLPGGAGIPGIEDNWITQIGDYRIGFYGVVDPEAREISSPGNAIFLDPVEVAAEQASLLRNRGADLVIGLAPLGEEDYEPVVEAGHSDIVLGYTGDDLMVWQTGKTLYARPKPGAREVVVIKVSLSREMIEVVAEEDGAADLDSLLEGGDPLAQEQAIMNLLQPTEVLEELRVALRVETRDVANYEPDVVMEAAVQNYQFALPRAMSRVLGEVSAPFDTREAAVRSGENPFGNWVADAIRQAAGTEIGLVNSGYIRGNRQHEAGDVMNWRSLVQELPFVNRVVALRLKGKNLKPLFEHAVENYEQNSGRFLQVSGLRVTYDITKPPGERVAEIAVGGEPVIPERLYSIAVPEFLGSGGDGFRAFRYAEQYEHPREGVFVLEALHEHLSAMPSLAPRLEGRIRFAER